MSAENFEAILNARRERRIVIKLHQPGQDHPLQNVEFLEPTNTPPVFEAGDEISGVVFLEVNGGQPVAKIRLGLICLSQVRWHTYAKRKSVINAMFASEDDSRKEHQIYFDRKQILQLDLGKGAPEAKWPNGKYELPFRVSLPTEGLPSTMRSCHGFIKYTLEVFTFDEDQYESRGEKEIVVVAPIHEKFDMHGRSLEKSLHILGSGKISMTGSLERKEYLPGELIPVEVTTLNDSSIPVQPLVSLYQTQVFACNQVHRTLETCLTSEPYTTPPVPPNHSATHIVKVPLSPSLVVSLRSALISVKYFVHVTADIPHSMDLSINLPFVVTTGSARAHNNQQLGQHNGGHIVKSPAQFHSAACSQQQQQNQNSLNRGRVQEFGTTNNV